jgi:hypothetical protein
MRYIIAALFVCLCSTIADGSVLVRESKYLPTTYGYGGGGWTSITSMLNAADTVQEVVDFSNATQVSSADALWIDLGPISGSGFLSAGEVTNIANFIASGKRVVMIGENTSWTSWNNQILGVVGGTAANSTSNGFASTATANALTNGVTGIYIPSGGLTSTAIGGTALFSQNVATLWGSEQNVLTLLDVNVYSDTYLSQPDNTEFAANTVAWITEDISEVVPEATSILAWSILALTGLAAASRRAEACAHTTATAMK